MDDSPRDLSRRRISGLRTETLTAVREGLNEAVEQPYGTGYRTVRLSGVTIAGKSGTAETSPGKPDHAWFTGYVPADAPRYAFVVVLEHGGSGSRAAGPVARELIRFMVDEQLIGD
jgi:penicillin-binding protein 2